MVDFIKVKRQAWKRKGASKLQKKQKQNEIKDQIEPATAISLLQKHNEQLVGIKETFHRKIHLLQHQYTSIVSDLMDQLRTAQQTRDNALSQAAAYDLHGDAALAVANQTALQQQSQLAEAQGHLYQFFQEPLTLPQYYGTGLDFRSKNLDYSGLGATQGFQQALYSNGKVRQDMEQIMDLHSTNWQQTDKLENRGGGYFQGPIPKHHEEKNQFSGDQPSLSQSSELMSTEFDRLSNQKSFLDQIDCPLPYKISETGTSNAEPYYPYCTSINPLPQPFYEDEQLTTDMVREFFQSKVVDNFDGLDAANNFIQKAACREGEQANINIPVSKEFNDQLKHSPTQNAQAFCQSDKSFQSIECQDNCQKNQQPPRSTVEYKLLGEFYSTMMTPSIDHIIDEELTQIFNDA